MGQATDRKAPGQSTKVNILTYMNPYQYLTVTLFYVCKQNYNSVKKGPKSPSSWNALFTRSTIFGIFELFSALFSVWLMAADSLFLITSVPGP